MTGFAGLSWSMGLWVCLRLFFSPEIQKWTLIIQFNSQISIEPPSAVGETRCDIITHLHRRGRKIYRID